MATAKIKSLDATTFQIPLSKLAEVLAQKLRREAPKLLAAPDYVAVDLHVLLRQMIYTYHLIFYLNADERAKTDSSWKVQYSIVTLPLIRNMIDCLYNITVILENPAANGAAFRKSGYKAILTALDEDEAKYGGKAEWDEWIAKARAFLADDMRRRKFKTADVMAASQWLTLGRYVKRLQPGGVLTPHQQFMKTLNYGPWREYSAKAHGAFDGLLDTGMYYISDAFLHEDRETIDQTHPMKIAMHISQAAGVLLSVATELQAYFHFDDDGARINERIHEMWKALMPTFTVKELYRTRYRRLMKEKRINAVPETSKGRTTRRVGR
jgi:hypothetical protein